MRLARLLVDPERCIACGLCERLAPALFAVAGHALAWPRPGPVAGADLELALETAETCPTEAIAVVPLVLTHADGGERET